MTKELNVLKGKELLETNGKQLYFAKDVEYSEISDLDDDFVKSVNGFTKVEKHGVSITLVIPEDTEATLITKKQISRNTGKEMVYTSIVINGITFEEILPEYMEGVFVKD